MDKKTIRSVIDTLKFFNAPSIPVHGKNGIEHWSLEKLESLLDGEF